MHRFLRSLKQQVSVIYAYFRLLVNQASLHRLILFRLDCIRDVKALHARLDEYSRSLSSDKKTKKQKAERSPISAITPAQQEGDRVADSGEEITLQERRDRLDREGVMLWNRGSVIKQALLFKQEGKEAAAANEASGISEEQETRQMLALRETSLERLCHVMPGANIPTSSPIRSSQACHSRQHEAICARR